MDTNSCLASDTVHVFVVGPPEIVGLSIDISNSEKIICMSDIINGFVESVSFFVDTISANRVKWSDDVGGEFTDNTGINPSFTPPAGYYGPVTVSVSVENNYCRMISDSLIILVDRCLDDITDNPIPQIITPNGDGANDFWVIDDIDYFRDNSMKIFNRWGNVVYAQQNYNNTWNGDNQRGSPLPAGTYFYLVDLGNGQDPYKGFVMIKRQKITVK